MADPAAIQNNGLLDAALGYLTGGLSLVPCSHQTKRPENALLPRDEDGKPSWKPYQEQPPSRQTVQGWFQRGCQSIAAIGGNVSGGLLIIDFDEARFYEAWREQVGNLADGLPVQRTGREGGGYQVWLRCLEPGRNDKLAYVRDETEEEGRRIAVETRAEGGYALAPGSLHPTGRRYEAISGDFTNIPVVSQAVADALLSAARKLDEAPLSRQQMETKEHAAGTCTKYRSNGRASVIDEYNRRTTIEEALEVHGYQRYGNRWKRPGGRSLSVTISDNRSFHHSSNDPLSNGFWRQPFEVFCELEHAGDCRAAVKAAAELLGLKSVISEKPHATRTAPAKTLPWRPFPTNVLPKPIQDYVLAGSRAMRCDPAYIALPMLAGLASAIGATRRITVKPGWHEPAVIWASVVAESGTMKSPAQALALQPLRAAQDWQLDQLPELLRQHERNKALYDADYAEWKRKGRSHGEPPPEKPMEPHANRYIVNDITIEALAEILSENPRGVLAAVDELATWLGGFDQYHARGGADVAKWLSIHRAESLIVDRKTATKKTLFVKRAAVSLAGTIQPRALRRALGDVYFDNGLAARLLLASPPRVAKKWTEASVDLDTYKAVERIYSRLLALNFASNEDEPAVPIDVPLSAEAKRIWISFYEEHAEVMEAAYGKLAAAYAKLEAYAARFALVFCMANIVSADTWTMANDVMIDMSSMMAGVELAKWFRYEAERVYAIIEESETEVERRQVVELIQRKGGRITANDLRRCSRRFATSDEAEKCLDELATAGAGVWETSEHGRAGGRPTRVFRLRMDVSVTETPKSSKKTEVSETAVGGNGDSESLTGPADDGLADDAVVSETPEFLGEDEV